MRVAIKTPSGSIPIALKSQQIELSSPLAILEVELEKGEACDICEGKDVHRCATGRNHHRLCLSTREISVVRLKTVGTIVALRLSCAGGAPVEDRDIENLIRFSNDLKALPANASGQISVNDFLLAVETAEITLLSVRKPLTGYDNHSLLDQMQSALKQKVRAICSSPKQGLRTEELVQDVSLVKRINTNTLSHLASHTEHWKTRTLNGLVPKRLKADVIEDEINIYENLFFKMAVDDIAEYVSRQILSLKAARRQNSIAIDWESYGAKINDYRRGLLLQKLLPGRDAGELVRENGVFDKALREWLQVSKVLSSIRGSVFYRKIDGKKRISRTVHLTNILKNDQRYKALYDLWCLVQKENRREQRERRSASNDLVDSVEDYYSTYTIIVLIYAMHLLDMRFSDDSFFALGEHGHIFVSASAEDRLFRYTLSTGQDQYGLTYLDLRLEEKVDVAVQLPAGCVFPENAFDDLGDVASFDAEKGRLRLHKMPNSEERKALRDLLHKPQSEVCRMSHREQLEYQRAWDAWAEFVTTLISNPRIHNPRTRTLRVAPLLFGMQPDATVVDKLSRNLFEGNEGYVCHLMHHSLEDYRELKDELLFRRLLNYGEAYHVSDMSEWKDYRVANLPATQTDIGTVQRLMKLVSLHRSKLTMDIEEGAPVHCPVCEGNRIKAIDEASWRCEDVGCGIEWGKTRCVEGCGEYFHWIRPSCAVKEGDFQGLSECDSILKKDGLFDRFIITDFEFNQGPGGYLKLSPVCPKCGARRFKRSACCV